MNLGDFVSFSLYSFSPRPRRAQGKKLNHKIGVHTAHIARLENLQIASSLPIIMKYPPLIKPGGSVRRERANFTRLVLGCIEGNFCK